MNLYSYTRITTKSQCLSTVKSYFDKGFSYCEILKFLSSRHGYTISIRTLNRLLREQNLVRRGRQLDFKLIIGAVIDELHNSGLNNGYRAVHQRLTRDGISVDRDTVRQTLKLLDPEGVELRSKHKLKRRMYFASGPNDIWHLDGNDKLKPHGFSIHGCIDGYSRKILWMHILPSNKDPYVISHYFIDAANEVGGIPRRMRADRGVENSVVAGVQRFLSRKFNNYQSSFIFGKSTGNQRIEAWWSFLKRTFLSQWMNYFKDLSDAGVFENSDPIQLECIRFCFYGLLQDQLDEVVNCWNEHRIRHCRNSESPAGRPDSLFFLPTLHHTTDKKNYISKSDFNLVKQLSKRTPVYGCDDKFAELAAILMREFDLNMPKDFASAEDLYLTILYRISQI